MSALECRPKPVKIIKSLIMYVPDDLHCFQCIISAVVVKFLKFCCGNPKCEQ